MITYQRFFILLLLTFSINAEPAARPTVIFDIHGVLLEENLASVFAQKIAALSPTRSLWDNKLFKRLCEVLAENPPLKDLPPCPGAGSSTLPYDVYALFSGYVSPAELKPRLLAALDGGTYSSPQEKLMITTLGATIFDQESLLASMKRITLGIALFKACQETGPVYILSNAPQEWIDEYPTAFPDIFENFPKDHLIASSSCGALKPDATLYDVVAKRIGTPSTTFELIDDSINNVAATRTLGVTAHHFNLTAFDDLVNTLVAQHILTLESAQALHTLAATEQITTPEALIKKSTLSDTSDEYTLTQLFE